MIELDTYKIPQAPTLSSGIRYLKTLYQSNYDRFKSRYLIELEQFLRMNDCRATDAILDHYDSEFRRVKPYDYKEALHLEKVVFKQLVFSAIDVPQMMEHLGHNLVKAQGIDLINRTFNTTTNSFEDIEMTQVYEMHQVNGSQIGINEPLYALRCWCTSTNKEHWLWLDKKYDNVLDAVASTCVIWEPMRGKIKKIIRQGDVFIFEMSEHVDITGSEQRIHMDGKTFYSLLKSQS